jgi:hypothetical protein
MLDPDAHGERLRLEREPPTLEEREHVARRMPGGEDHAASGHLVARRGDDAGHDPAREDEVGDPGPEADLATAVGDRRAQRLHHLREAVRPDVRMGVDQDVGRRAVAHQHLEHVPDGAAFGRARVELPVGERARATLAEAVVALRVDDPRAAELRHGVTAGADVGAALQDDGPEPALDQCERGEETGGPGSHHHDGRRPLHVAERERRRGLGAERLVDPDPDAEDAGGRSLARVEGAADDRVVGDRVRRDAEPAREAVRALGRVVGRIGRDADLGLGDHPVGRATTPAARTQSHPATAHRGRTVALSTIGVPRYRRDGASSAVSGACARGS